MRKMETTKKQILESYSKVVCLGYDTLCILGIHDPKYCTSGKFGWNADIYEINPDCAICAGYRPFRNIKVDSNLIKSIREKATKINNNKIWKDATKRKKIEKLILELFE